MTDRCKPAEFLCPVCKTQGMLIGKTDDYQKTLDLYYEQIWKFMVRIYEDEPETNLKCRVCSYQINGRPDRFTHYL